MSSLDRVSTLINSQLPEFIRSDYPVFAEFIEKYYEFLEQPGKPIYELKTFEDNYNVDFTRSDLLKYFRTKILPSFPEESELSTERIIKAARDFYTKKGTPDSFKFLFRVLYNKDLDIFFPKLQILRASDGKWILPQAFRLTSSPENSSVILTQLKNQRATGLVSRASCIVERAYKTIDVSSSKEIYEIYVSSVTRAFFNNEVLEIPYIDQNGDAQFFREKIIGSLSNLKINPRRRGKRYQTGDPVVINGGQNLNSLTKRKAVALVGNVTTASLDSTTIIRKGYGFSTYPNTYVDIITPNPVTGKFDGLGNGSGGNIIVTAIDTTAAAGNIISIPFNTDAITFKSNNYLYENHFDFDNTSPTTLFTATSAGSTQTTINIAANPTISSSNDFYNNYVIRIVSGTGADGTGAKINAVVIADYIGANNMAICNSNTSLIGTVNISGINVEANTSYQNFADFTAGVPGFYTYLTAGKDIEINGELRTIASVTNSKHLTVTVAFSAAATDKKLNANSTLTTAPDATSSLMLTTSIDSRVGGAFYYETLTLYPIQTTTIISGGADFDSDPPALLNVASLYESDLSISGFVSLTPGKFFSYNKSNASFRLSSEFSSINDFYSRRRIKLEHQFRTIIDYDGATRTVFLDRPFETNINELNILNKTLRIDNRPVISSMGVIAQIEIENGGSGYTVSTPLIFGGTGFGAAATVSSVGAGGAITAIAISNRGEGYPVAPTVTVGGAGSGAVLRAYLLGDGEQINATAGLLGEIIDFTLIDRGSDYILRPNVSLKIFDLFISGNTTNISSIKENDVIFQGPNNARTFTGIVDGLYESNTVLRVFNYSGTPTAGDIVVTRANQIGIFSNIHNTGIATANANAYGKTYPVSYGNAKAKANAEFLNGLIRFNGFYLNTDGHVSSEKRLQDSDRYHNFSYSLVSEESFDTYKKTIFDVSHPTGTKLLPIHVVPVIHTAGPIVNTNSHAIVVPSNTFIGNCSITYEANNVIGGAESFDVIANVNDIIIVNSSNATRSFAKTITVIANNNSLNIESPCILIGEGRAHIQSGNAIIKVVGNTNVVAKFITTNDKIRLKVDGTTLLKTINDITGNLITVNSSTGITNTTNLTIDTTNAQNFGKPTVPSLVYEVIPQFNNVEYKIIRT